MKHNWLKIWILVFSAILLVLNIFGGHSLDFFFLIKHGAGIQKDKYAYLQRLLAPTFTNGASSR